MNFKNYKTEITVFTLAALFLSAAFCNLLQWNSGNKKQAEIQRLQTACNVKDSAINSLQTICREDSIKFEQHAAIGQQISNLAASLFITVKIGQRN